MSRKILSEKICDVCGKNEQEAGKTRCWNITRYFGLIRRKLAIVPYEKCDVCPECSDKINEFVETLKKENT